MSMTTTTKIAARGPDPLLPCHWSTLDSLLWAYLLLPVLIFLPGFSFPPWACHWPPLRLPVVCISLPESGGARLQKYRRLAT